ncbi:hypothetical protein BDA99DRAFT_534588 [Phascolomyces articulosus]|uniref:F-box domain-containing protein n=1 Tax=Phascolomyces articulosus TaxID=60185 RepID=A0AAD5PGS3_9FUNG|nr:hypothetical protein BDA99DRAFT_534588 [Phascolomyces articulosus]
MSTAPTLVQNDNLLDNPKSILSPNGNVTTTVNTNDPAQVSSITEQALDNAHFDTTIEIATPAIQDFLTHVVQLLRMRAEAWGQKGRYDKALQDSSAIITHAPTNPIGYLSTGRRYAEQGFQVRAIDIFKKGLEYVPTNDPYYDTLYEEKQQAKRRYAHRLDAFEYLPFDVIYRVIEYIPLETVAQCSRVSSNWRTLVLNYPKFWRSLNVCSFTGQGILSPYKLLPSISHHVEQLSLPQGKQAKNCTELIGKNSFPNLRSIQVKRTVPNYKLQNHYTDFSTALINVADTLESLDLYLEGTDNLPYLSDILSICRNLTSIKFTTKVPEAITTNLIIPYVTKLTKIELSATDGRLNSNELQSLFEHSPHLRYLYVNFCFDDVYDIVQKYCPKNLDVLSVNGKAWWDSAAGKRSFSTSLINSNSNATTPITSPTSSPPQPSSSSSAVGLTVLTCHGFHLPDSLISMLEKHHMTLQSLEIQTLFGVQLVEWPYLAGFPLVNLVFLRIDYIPLQLCHQVDCLLKQTPNLKYLHLSRSGHNLIPDDAFKVIEDMPRIEEIYLSSCNFNPPYLQQLLKAFAENRTKSLSLNVLRIENCAGMNESILEICACIQSLSNITISMNGSRKKKESIEMFVQDAARLPHLKHLCIGYADLTKEDLDVLSSSPSLSLIHFISIHGVTPEQIKHAFPPHVDVRF